jgi:hypothetical protein
MLKCYDQSKIENNLFKCDQCKQKFDHYCQPRFLPCYKTVCTTCVSRIEKEAVNRKFKCDICLNEHQIPEDGFALNEKIYDLLTSEQMEISRGKEHDQLEINLSNLYSSARSLKFESENGTDVIKEHCIEQLRRIQLATENKIEQIYKSNDKLVDQVKQYEKKCLQINSNKSESIKEKINQIIDKTDLFINEKQAYLYQYKTNEEEIKTFNKTSEEFKAILEEEKIKLKSLIFNDEIIEFNINQDEIDECLLGNIDYEPIIEPSVAKFFLFDF